MPNHFTPIGNSANIRTIKNNEIAVSLNIDEFAKAGNQMNLRKLSETPLQHLRRIVRLKPRSNVSRELIERASLFLAIRKSVLHSEKQAIPGRKS